MSSRVGRKPISLPHGVEVKVEGHLVTVKGPKGQVQHTLHPSCRIDVEGSTLTVVPDTQFIDANVQAGTARAILNNHIYGVSQGFVRKLILVGVGYRAKAEKKGASFVLDLTLGLSHPCIYTAPPGVEISTPTQTEIEIKGVDKQVIGQVADEIRRRRPPEPYKGKGIRFAEQRIILKETKKKSK